MPGKNRVNLADIMYDFHIASVQTWMRVHAQRVPSRSVIPSPLVTLLAVT